MLMSLKGERVVHGELRDFAGLNPCQKTIMMRYHFQLGVMALISAALASSPHAGLTWSSSSLCRKPRSTMTFFLEDCLATVNNSNDCTLN